jgi:hypothetical protein
MPALDRNSIGLNAVCCCLFIDKAFQRTSPRVARLCAPSGKRYSHQAIRILGSLRQKYCDVCRNRAVLGRWVRSENTRLCFYEGSYPATQSVSGRRSHSLCGAKAGSCGETFCILWGSARIAGGMRRRSETRFRIRSSKQYQECFYQYREASLSQPAFLGVVHAGAGSLPRLW